MNDDEMLHHRYIALAVQQRARFATYNNSQMKDMTFDRGRDFPSANNYLQSMHAYPACFPRHQAGEMIRGRAHAFDMHYGPPNHRMRFHPYNKAHILRRSDECEDEVPYIHHCAEEYGLQTVVIQCRSMQAEDIDVDTSEIQSKCEKKDRSALEIVKEVVIFPRRKAGQSKRQPDNQAPIKLTKEMLEDMFDVPLVAAAVKLGISKTALKNACRHLGILHWPFRKRMQEANFLTNGMSHAEDGSMTSQVGAKSPKNSSMDEDEESSDDEQDENVPKRSSNVPAWRDACTSHTNHATNLRIPPPVSLFLETPPPTWHHEKPKLDNQPKLYNQPDDFSCLGLVMGACPSSSSATEALHPLFQSFQHSKPGGKGFIGMEGFHDEARSTEAPKDRFSCKLTGSSLKPMLPMLLEDMQSQVEQLSICQVF